MQLPTIDPSDIESFMKLLENMTSSFSEIQQESLEQILTKNAKTEYLKGYLDGCPNKELFKEKFPVAKYEDIKNYIDRIANGEPSDVIVAELYKCSGTSSGKPKLIPATIEATNRKAFFFDLAYDILAKRIEFPSQGKRIFFRFVAPAIFTPGSLAVRYATSSNLRSKTVRNPVIKFDALIDLFVSQGTSLSQYETPKCVKSDEAIQLLNSMVVGSFSSKVVLAG